METVTIVLPISRPDYLDRIFAQLELMDCDIPNTNLLAYIDGDHRLYSKARNLVVNSKFADKLCVMRSKGIPSVGSVHRRRQRIADIHNEIKELINHSEYVFLLEDDTLFPKHTLMRLMKNYREKPYAGLISAVQLGRWGYTSQGLWTCDDVYDPKIITSLKEGSGLQEIDASGFYCLLTRTETYLNHKFEPFEKALGPDVNFGLELRKAGLMNYADLDIKTIHLTKRGQIRLDNSDIIQVQLQKTPGKAFEWKTVVL